MALPTTEGIEASAHAVPIPSGQEFLSAQEREAPVFATHTAHRARVVIGAGAGLATLAVLWLAALLVGAFGLRGLPPVPLPQMGSDEAPATGAGLRNDRSDSDSSLRDGDRPMYRRDVGGKLEGPRTRGSEAPGQTGPRTRPGRDLDGYTPTTLPQQAPSQRIVPAGSPVAAIPQQPYQRTVPAAQPKKAPSGTGAGGTAPATSPDPTYTPSGKPIPAGRDTSAPAGPPSALPDQALDRRASAR
jgi:hypothetical protein